jgi:hypothetical protein
MIKIIFGGYHSNTKVLNVNGVRKIQQTMLFRGEIE